MRRSGFTVMRKLAGLIRPLAGFMVLAVLMGLAGNLAATFITILGGYGILSVLNLSQISLTVLFVVALVLALLRGVLRYGEQACNHYIAFRLLALIRDKVFTALRKLAPAKLDGKDKGDLISLITSDTELLEVFYAHTVSPICIAILYSLIMFVFISREHFILGMYALVSWVVIGLLMPVLISHLSKDDGMQYRTKAGKLSGYVLENLRGMDEILQYNQGRTRIENMNTMTEELNKDNYRMKMKTGFNTALSNVLILLLDIGMLVLAIHVTDFSHALIAVLALMSSFGPVLALAALGSTLQNTFAAGNRILDLLEEEPVVKEIHNKKDVVFHGAKAQSVSFAYQEDSVLDNISLEAEQGKIIGIHGRSGSGKSTLLKLFMRFYETDAGKITISEEDINAVNTENLRNMESFVSQSTYLYHDSIRNNLLLAKQDATEEELIEACKKASIHEFILSLPHGYDTEVGELGDTLSGGERQRLGLARAFLHNADFMLLDEPTSNLDSLNEAVILKSLHEEHGNKTVLLVSHRPSTMAIADVVYSVENGRMS